MYKSRLPTTIRLLVHIIWLWVPLDLFSRSKGKKEFHCTQFFTVYSGIISLLAILNNRDESNKEIVRAAFRRTMCSATSKVGNRLLSFYNTDNYK